MSIAKELQQHKIKIKLIGKNKNSNGAEVWIHRIKTEKIENIDLKRIQCDHLWQLRSDNESPIKPCLISSTIGGELEVDIVGERLEVECLSHQWSGKVEILDNGKSVQIVDLFSNISKMVTVIISLRDE